ncbi:hypothetical protein ABTY61_09995 [Kitasatospora sp. NPDC096128]|uniref:hypothetical protein n=1 Tax=Kitasatospora sp. NPDC096128 TaxID=3155547 RepID=UPI003324B0B0
MLDPLVGVGPLRFGMRPREVEAALEGTAAGSSWSADEQAPWRHYRDLGVTAFYGPGPSLVAVAVDGLRGPSVGLRDVELIARVPSELRADLLELARVEGAPVRVNRGGEPEVAAWGVSMGATHEWKVAVAGHIERTSRAITSALLVGPELAEDPSGAEPVVRWRGVREWEAESGERPVTPGRERPRWGCVPLESVGPLRFGMTPSQVAAALSGAEPAVRRGSFPESWSRLPPEAGQWFLSEDVFDGLGVTAHYGYWSNAPVLGAVTVHAFAGPQVEWEGVRLIGRPVSEVEAELCQYIEGQGMGLRILPTGDQGPDGENWYVRAVRAGDTMLSEVQFCAEEWWEE